MGYHFSSPGSCWERTTLVAKSKLLASMRKGSKFWRDIRTRALVTTVLSASKALCFFLFQDQSMLDFVRSNRGQTSIEKPWMNQQ